MQVSFNTYTSPARASFKALDVAKISKNTAEAGMFLTDVALGMIKKEGNEVDLIAAFKRAPNIGVENSLKAVAKRWGIQLPTTK